MLFAWYTFLSAEVHVRWVYHIFSSKEYRPENYPSRYVDSVIGIFSQKSYISTSAFQLSVSKFNSKGAFNICLWNCNIQPCKCFNAHLGILNNGNEKKIIKGVKIWYLPKLTFRLKEHSKCGFLKNEQNYIVLHLRRDIKTL